jgi:hypothetical protein
MMDERNVREYCVRRVADQLFKDNVLAIDAGWPRDLHDWRLAERFVDGQRALIEEIAFNLPEDAAYETFNDRYGDVMWRAVYGPLNEFILREYLVRVAAQYFYKTVGLASGVSSAREVIDWESAEECVDASMERLAWTRLEFKYGMDFETFRGRYEVSVRIFFRECRNGLSRPPYGAILFG